MYYLVRDYYDETKHKIFSDKDDIEEYIGEFDNSKELLLVYNWEKGMYNDTRNGKRIYFDQYFILKKSENVFDLIEVGDLVEGKWRFWQRFIREVVSLASYEEYKIITLDGFVSVSVSNNRENTDKVDAIYKPNKKGDYIKVWERGIEHDR